MLRSVVLPLVIGYAGILAFVASAASMPPRRPGTDGAPAPIGLRRLALHTIGTAAGGVIVLLAALGVYCSARGGDAGVCLAEGVRGIVPLAFAIACPGLLTIEVASRAVRRLRRPT